jgi:hypothetical protein
VTPNKHLLLNTYPCNRLIKVTNGGHVVASLIGDVPLKSTCGSYLMLKGIQYSPKFNKNIISAPQLLKSHDYIITMKKSYVMVQYKSTVLKMLYRASANLYFFKGVRLLESVLQYLYLNKENKKVRVLSKITCNRNNYKEKPLLPNCPKSFSINTAKYGEVYNMNEKDYGKNQYEDDITGKHGNTTVPIIGAEFSAPNKE